MNKVSSTEVDDRVAESAEQDQTARMCRLILLYSLRQNKPMTANGHGKA